MKECLLITLIVLIVLVISDIALFIVILSNNSKEKLSLRIRLNEFEDKLNNLISGSKRVERICDAINQRTRSYISNNNDKRNQKTNNKKSSNNSSSKNKQAAKHKTQKVIK